MKLSQLDPVELKRELREGALRLRTGPFAVSIRTRVPAVIDGLRLLYADFPIAEDESFADFHLYLARRRGIRGWIVPEGVVSVSGLLQFSPFPYRMAMSYLEWGLNWCVANLAHQYLALHAAVVERGGRAAIIIGRPGTGKSTLCAALALRGWRLLSDEFGLFSPRDGNLHPLARPISLKNESIEVIRRFSPDAVLGASNSSTHKGMVAHMRPPTESVARMMEPARPAWFIFLSYRAGQPAMLREIPKARAMIRAADNTFNYRILGQAAFETLAAAMDDAECLHFVYGDLEDGIGRLERLWAPDLAVVQ